MKSLSCIFAGAAALLVSACVSVEQLAPPPAQFHNTNASVAEGRDIYLTNCTKCHGVKPVLGTSLGDWQGDVLPTMCEKAKLAPAQRQAVSAYISAVHKAAPMLPEAKR
jgi:mono/diheme cytochrome c family protein